MWLKTTHMEACILKKMTVALLFLLIFLPVLGVQALDDFTTGPQSLAAYFPQDTNIFISIRTDEGYLDQLDSLGDRLLAQINSPEFETLLEQDVPPISLRDTLNIALTELGTDLGALYEWLGDHSAVGLTFEMTEFGPGDVDEGATFFVLEISDKDAALNFLTEQLGDRLRVREDEEADFTVLVYPPERSIFYINDEVLIVGNRQLDVADFSRETSLLENADFMTTMNSLPGNNYNFVSYIDLETLLTPNLAQSGLDSMSVGGLGIAGTILDETTLVLDTVQLTGGAMSSDAAQVDADFLRFVPENASAVVHASDLTALYEQLTATLTDIAIANGDSDPTPQIEMLVGVGGIDLRQDILDWTTGDYALFARLDPVPAVRALANQELDIANRFDLGMVVEATDAEKASALAKNLSTLLAAVVDPETGATVSDAQINGVDVTLISISGPIPDFGTLTVEVVIGASDEVFFISTRNAAEDILDGTGTYADNSGYIDASGYLLPDATSVWVTDGTGSLSVLSIPTLGVLTVLGPSIGNVFEQIITEFGNDEPRPTATPTPTPTPIPIPDPRVMALADALEATINSIDSTSISSRITEAGAVVVRMTISYSE